MTPAGSRPCSGSSRRRPAGDDAVPPLPPSRQPRYEPGHRLRGTLPSQIFCDGLESPQRGGPLPAGRLDRLVEGVIDVIVDYSINLSAPARSARGTARPSASAVLRLTISSNLADCRIGSSAGVAPLRIHPT